MEDSLRVKVSFSQRITALDGLRGIAALMVLFHHMLLTVPDYANFAWYGPNAPVNGPLEFALIRTPLRLLWAGQERALLFFVLSGFVLALPWLKGRPQPYGRFLLNRFCRIYPPYIIAMVLAAAGFALIGGHPLAAASVYVRSDGWGQAPPGSWGAIAPSVAGVLANPSSAFLDEAVWSLVWEVRVALIFPLLMLPMVRWGNIGAAATLALMFPLKSLAARFTSPDVAAFLNYPAETFYFAEYFIVGATVAMNQAAIRSWFGRQNRAMGPVFLVLGCMVCWAPWPVEHDRIVGVGAAFIIAVIVGSAQVQRLFDGAALIWLGRQSYSLYLIHVPIIMAVDVAFHGEIPLLALCAIPPVAIVLAEAFHRGVELPSVAFTQRLTGLVLRAPGVKPIAHAPMR